ncbi:MAG: cobalamin biosynthesis protein CbiD, partial [Syntrophomonas sp.]|nr:cobalamin biosynthesis protein CbiD [Syntrophomonas sp.]
HTALIGGGTQLIARIMQLNTIDEAPALLQEYGLERVWDAIAAAASERCQLRIGDGFKVGTVLYTLDGTILAYDREAAQLGRQMAWRLP